MSKRKRSPQVDKMVDGFIIVERIILDDDDSVQESESPNCLFLYGTINWQDLSSHKLFYIFAKTKSRRPRGSPHSKVVNQARTTSSFEHLTIDRISPSKRVPISSNLQRRSKMHLSLGIGTFVPSFNLLGYSIQNFLRAIDREFPGCLFEIEYENKGSADEQAFVKCLDCSGIGFKWLS